MKNTIIFVLVVLIGFTALTLITEQAVNWDDFLGRVITIASGAAFAFVGSAMWGVFVPQQWPGLIKKNSVPKLRAMVFVFFFVTALITAFATNRLWVPDENKMSLFNMIIFSIGAGIVCVQGFFYGLKNLLKSTE